MRRINPPLAAFTVGLVIGLYHLAWVVLVATGAAKPVLDYILRLHFLEFSYTLAPFSADSAIMLVVVTYVIGALFGLVFALIWNWLTGAGSREEKAKPDRSFARPAAG